MFSPAERAQIENAAHHAGYDVPEDASSEQLGFSSSQAPGTVTVTKSGDGGIAIATQLSLVASELAREFEIKIEGTNVLLLPAGETIYPVLSRAFNLSISLPDTPLQRFLQATRGMPRTTEAERLAVVRVGQGVFRDALVDYWGGRCPVTKISDAPLLRASHIKPWNISSDEERLDVFNGILLAAHLDAVFDKALMTIQSDGVVQFSQLLSREALAALNPAGRQLTVRISDRHQIYLDGHRAKFAKVEATRVLDQVEPALVPEGG